MCRLSWNLGASTSWNPLGLFRPVMGLLCFLRAPERSVFELHISTPRAHFWNGIKISVSSLTAVCMCSVPFVWECQGYVTGRHSVAIWPGTSWPNTTVFSLTSYSRPRMNKYFKQFFNRSSYYILCIYLTTWTGYLIFYSNIVILFFICPSKTAEKKNL